MRRTVLRIYHKCCGWRANWHSALLVNLASPNLLIAGWHVAARQNDLPTYRPTDRPTDRQYRFWHGQGIGRGLGQARYRHCGVLWAGRKMDGGAAGVTLTSGL